MDEESLNRHQITGFFSDGTSKVEKLSIPLPVLLTFPVFWKPSKIIGFYRDSWDSIKRPDTREGPEKQQIENFRAQLKKDSKLAFPPDQPNWIEILGESHWKVLQKDGFGTKKKDEDGEDQDEMETANRKRNPSGSYKPAQVEHLLRLIRNQLAHKDERSTEDKNLLGWYPDGRFSESAFVNYWSSRFPKLLLFLWWKFYEFENTEGFQHYFYENSLDHYDFESLTWNEDTVIPGLVQLLYSALEANFLEGGMPQRFLCTTTKKKPITSVLEFRCFKEETVAKLLDECSTLKIEVNDSGIYTTRTILCNNDVCIQSSLQFLGHSNVCPERENTLAIFAVSSNYKDEELVVACDNLKVMFLVREEKFEASVKSITDKYLNVNKLQKVSKTNSAITWEEVKKMQSEILNSRKIGLQNYNSDHKRIVTLKDILPSDVDEAEVILKNLKGGSLITLLKEGTLNLMCKNRLSNLPPRTKYLERRLCSRREVSDKILRHRKSDVILVVGFSLDKLQQLVNPTDTVCCFEQAVTDLVGDKMGRIFLVENNNIDCEELVSKFRQRFRSFDGSIHVLAHYKDKLFRWLYSHGSLDIISQSFPSDLVLLSEREFISSIHETTAGNTSPIFIIDKPGMGKSLLLTNLANEIHKTYPSSLVLFMNMNDFVMKLLKIEVLGNADCPEKIKLAVAELIHKTLCEGGDSFETSLVEFLLQPNCTKRFTCELFLDGLDEVTKKYKKLALSILEVISHELPHVRLWVTCREYMQSEIERTFSVLCYKISPFSDKDMIQFLQNHWLTKARNLSRSSNSNKVKLNEVLNEFAVKCVEQTNTKPLSIEIAGAPLQCRMIAEIYEDALPCIINGLIDTPTKKSLTAMYKFMVDKKLRLYLKDKKEFMNLDEDEDDVFESQKEEMLLWHMFYACKLIFPDWYVEKISCHLNVKKHNASRMKSAVADQGILENLDPPRFIHRTFAEYFAALFIYNALKNEFPNISGPNSEDFAELLTNEVFEGTKQNSQTLKNVKILKFKLPSLIYFLNEMLVENSETSTTVVRFVALKMHDFNPDTIKFESDKSTLSTLMVENHFSLAKTLIEALELNDKNRFLEKTKHLHKHFLEILIRHADVQFFKYFCELLENWSGTGGNVSEENSVIDSNTFNLALEKGNFPIVKYLVEEKGFNPEKWRQIRESDKKLMGVVHHVISKSRHDTETDLENKKRLLEYLVGLDSNVLEDQDVDGRTPILLPSVTVCFELKKFLVQKLKANINAVGKYNNSVLHWKDCTKYASGVTASQYHYMLQFYLDNGFKHINLVKKADKYTPLICAVKTYFDSLLPESLDLFKNAKADFSARDSNDRTVKEVCIRRKCKQEFINKLSDCEAES